MKNKKQIEKIELITHEGLNEFMTAYNIEILNGFKLVDYEFIKIKKRLDKLEKRK